jgi:hypothetical protein
MTAIRLLLFAANDAAKFGVLLQRLYAGDAFDGAKGTKI